MIRPGINVGKNGESAKLNQQKPPFRQTAAHEPSFCVPSSALTVRQGSISGAGAPQPRLKPLDPFCGVRLFGEGLGLPHAKERKKCPSGLPVSFLLHIFAEEIRKILDFNKVKSC